MDVTYENIPKWSNAKSNTSDPLEFCKQYYPDVFRGRLQILDSNLYAALRERGYLKYIPKKYDRK